MLLPFAIPFEPSDLLLQHDCLFAQSHAILLRLAQHLKRLNPKMFRMSRNKKYEPRRVSEKALVPPTGVRFSSSSWRACLKEPQSLASMN